jgi:nucleobase:cation symporter-1, NCS1 family
MILNGHAGAKYGIPFPVLARSSFGILGANVPAMLRAIVACGWFGIQTWIGGYSIFLMLRVWFPAIESWPDFLPAFMGLKSGPALTFMVFWFFNVLVVYKGVDSIRRLLVFKAFFLPLAALALLFWAISEGNGLGPILSQPAHFDKGEDFWKFFFPALTGMVGYWATLSLNIPDFTRYAINQRAQIVGQAIGLPPAMTLFSFIGVVVTSATVIIYGEMIWDPLVLAGKFESRVLVSFAMLAVAISTLATNIAANIVSPANDFANLRPSRISFRTGGLITCIIGIIIMPWKLVSDPNGYIFTWLIAYSSLLGPIGGIMIADYYFIRKKILSIKALYSLRLDYAYRKGYNPSAFFALIVGIVPNIPGFLTNVNLVSETLFPAWLSGIYNYAWFVGFIISGSIYIFSMKYTSIKNGQSAIV